MMNRYLPPTLHAFLDRLAPIWLMPLCIATAAGLSLLDYLTWEELSFSVFYLLPVSIGAWYISHRAGLWISATSAISWAIADAADSIHYSHWFAPLWNTESRFVFYALSSFLLARVRTELEIIKSLALMDPLTRLSNSRHFRELAAHELDRFARHGRPFSVAFIDLDNFKQVNDRFGHQAGDELLRSVAQGLRRGARAEDVVARLGGDEFAILFPELDEASALDVMERLRGELLRWIEEKAWPVTLSVGLVTYRRAPASIDEMINHADCLMYEVKFSGKNAVRSKVWGLDPA